MRELRFDSNILTTHEGIDRQHEAMFAWGRKILFTPSEVSTLDLARAIHFLGTYVRYHFAAEESLMHSHGYERAALHGEQHERLRDQAGQIERAASAGQSHAQLLARVHALFDEWYVYHINEWDKPLAAFIRSTSADKPSRELPTVEQLLEGGRLGPATDFDLDAVKRVAQERWHRPPKRA